MRSERRTAHAAAGGLQIVLDRDLTVPVGTQVRGQIEYAVATGELPPGARLPSVRELATGLGVAPVTISHAYRDLRLQGLIETVQGSGTFVPEQPVPERTYEPLVSLALEIDQLFTVAGELGFSPPQAAEIVALRAAHPHGRDAPVRVLFVGIYAGATREYVAAIRRHVRARATIQGVTFDEVAARPLPEADLVVTLAHRRAEVRARVGPDLPVVTPGFLPTRPTRGRLALVTPDARMVVVAGVPAFLQTLRRFVTRYAPHVREIRAAMLDAPELNALLAEADTVVHATGADEVRGRTAPGVEVFEFRYEPDPVSLNETLLPAIETIRARRIRAGLDSAPTPTPQEDHP